MHIRNFDPLSSRCKTLMSSKRIQFMLRIRCTAQSIYLKTFEWITFTEQCSKTPLFQANHYNERIIGHFRSLHSRPCWLSCINEYLAIDSGGNVSNLLVFARNCCLARMLPGEAENGVGMNRSVREGKNVKRFERSNGLDTALYKNYLYLFIILTEQYFTTGQPSSDL